MRFLIFVTMIGSVGVSVPVLANTNVTCVTKDFNPVKIVGSKLNLSFNKGQLISATLVKGSWGCDGKDSSPKKVANSPKGTIYSVNFGEMCDGFSYNSRIFAPISNEAPTWIAFNFSYLTDDSPGQLKDVLSCQ